MGDTGWKWTVDVEQDCEGEMQNRRQRHNVSSLKQSCDVHMVYPYWMYLSFRIEHYFPHLHFYDEDDSTLYEVKSRHSLLRATAYHTL